MWKVKLQPMLCIQLPPFPLITRDLTYLRQCNTLDRNPIFYSFSRLTANCGQHKCTHLW